MHSSLTIANRFLALATERGDTLTPMQLLKLVYIAHGWMLGLYGVPLINHSVQAWKYGPVIPELYRAINQFRSSPVQGPLPAPADDGLVGLEEDLIDQVYDLYGMRSGLDLSRLTHKPGSPWAQTYREGVSNLVISNDLIEDHYQTLARKAAE
jgi:uncharacterized phage-associated protein